MTIKFAESSQNALAETLSPWMIAMALLVAFSLPPNQAMAQTVTLTHGPVTGAVDANDAKVFVRTSAAASVAIVYSTDPGLANPTTSTTVSTNAAADFTAMIQLNSLQHLTTYYMNISVNGAPQLARPFPSFTTFAPTGTPANFKFVVMTDFANVPTIPPYNYTSFASAAAENPAFVFIGGDFDHRNPHALADKQQMFKDLYNPASPGMADFVNKVLRRFPVVHQWDDHDSGTNNVDKTYTGWNLAYQVFTEYMPMYSTVAPPPGIWQKLSYAQADFFVMDNRSQRSPEYDIDNATKGMLDGRHLGSAGELAWLKSGLLTSQATWKVVFTSVVTNPTTRYEDGWAGYQAEWNALRKFVSQNKIKNVFFVSGDLHFGGIDNGIASGIPEMLVGNINILLNPGINCAAGLIGRWSQGTYYTTTGDCMQYGVVTLSTNPDQALMQIKDENGNVRVSYTLNAM
jgi:alkaline phosphatase D